MVSAPDLHSGGLLVRAQYRPLNFYSKKQLLFLGIFCIIATLQIDIRGRRLAWFKALDCRSSDRGFKSHRPRLIIR